MTPHQMTQTWKPKRDPRTRQHTHTDIFPLLPCFVLLFLTEVVHCTWTNGRGRPVRVWYCVGTKRRESSKRNYYINSSRVIIKAIIIKRVCVNECTLNTSKNLTRDCAGIADVQARIHESHQKSNFSLCGPAGRHPTLTMHIGGFTHSHTIHTTLTLSGLHHSGMKAQCAERDSQWHVCATHLGESLSALAEHGSNCPSWAVG